MKLNSDVRELLSLFAKWKIKFVLIGGHAMGVHGVMRYTQDIDFYVGNTPSNVEAVRNAIIEFFQTDEGLPTTQEICQKGKILSFGMEPQRVDILSDIKGVSFEEVWNSRIKGTLDGVPMYVISRDCLLKNKKATNRDKDILDVKLLNRIKVPDP